MERKTQSTDEGRTGQLDERVDRTRPPRPRSELTLDEQTLEFESGVRNVARGKAKAKASWPPNSHYGAEHDREDLSQPLEFETWESLDDHPQSLNRKIKSRRFAENPHTNRFICEVVLTNDFPVSSAPQPSKTMAWIDMQGRLDQLFGFHYHCIRTQSFQDEPKIDADDKSNLIVERWYRSGIDE